MFACNLFRRIWTFKTTSYSDEAITWQEPSGTTLASHIRSILHLFSYLQVSREHWQGRGFKRPVFEQTNCRISIRTGRTVWSYHTTSFRLMLKIFNGSASIQNLTSFDRSDLGSNNYEWQMACEHLLQSITEKTKNNKTNDTQHTPGQPATNVQKSRPSQNTPAHTESKQKKTNKNTWSHESTHLFYYLYAVIQKRLRVT